MLDFHKDFLPTHTEAEVNAIRTSLQINGLESAIICDAEGNIIDGRLRVRLSEELKIDWRHNAEIRHGLNDAEKLALRIRLNVLRRHTRPSTEQRSLYVEVCLKADPELSPAKIAEMLGVSRSTISRKRIRLANKGKIKMPTHIRSKDGRRRQMPKRLRIPVSSKAEFKMAVNGLDALGGQVPHGRMISPQHVRRKARRVKKKADREAYANKNRQPTQTENISLYHCEFSDLPVNSLSVDLYFSDVVWGLQSVDDWKKLAVLAEGWLKPDGIFASFIGPRTCGQFCEAVQSSSGLTYVGQIVTLHDKPTRQTNQVIRRHTPIALFAKNHDHRFNGLLDVIGPYAIEKTHHEWQQSLGATKKVIQMLTDPGDLIVDGQVGSGTSALATWLAGGDRRFSGGDQEQKALNIASWRLETMFRLRCEAESRVA